MSLQLRFMSTRQQDDADQSILHYTEAILLSRPWRSWQYDVVQTFSSIAFVIFFEPTTSGNPKMSSAVLRFSATFMDNGMMYPVATTFTILSQKFLSVRWQSR